MGTLLANARPVRRKRESNCCGPSVDRAGTLTASLGLGKEILVGGKSDPQKGHKSLQFVFVWILAE